MASDEGWHSLGWSLRGRGCCSWTSPTNHLDLPSREAFETAFESFDGAALVITHDRFFIERFAGRVIEL